MKQRILYIPEMRCQHCINTISHILQQAGLHDFQISLEQHFLTLSTDKLQEIIFLLNEAGYDSEIIP